MLPGYPAFGRPAVQAHLLASYQIRGCKMALKTTVCPKCGTAYQYDPDISLWPPKCPTCYALEEQRKIAERAARDERERLEELKRLERELEEQRAARERELEEQRAAREWAALQEQRRIAAESWRLQAQSKVDRANELVWAGLYAEAAALYREAITQDPGNIAAYQGLATALLWLNQHKSARETIAKHLPLLRNATDAEIQEAIDLILATQPNADLWEGFLRISARYIHNPTEVVSWLIEKGETERAFALHASVAPIYHPQSHTALQEIGILAHFSQSDLTRNEAYSLWETFAEGSSHWDFEPSGVLYALLDQAPREIIALVLDKVQSKVRCLLGYAVGVEIHPEHTGEILNSYLANKGFKQREAVIEEFRELRGKEKLSLQTIEVIRQFLLGWYKAKQPEIAAENRRLSWEKVKPVSWMGWVGGCLGCLLGSLISAFILELTPSSSSDDPRVVCCYLASPVISLVVLRFAARLFSEYIRAEKALRELRQQEERLLAELLR